MWKHHFFLMAAVLLLLIAGCSDGGTMSNPDPDPDPDPDPPPVEQPLARQVGINVNEQLDLMKFENIERSNTSWARGFLPFFQMYPNTENLDNNPRIENFIELKRQGYNTILNIKWDFSDRSFPSPGSNEMEAQKQFLEDIFRRVWSSIDIIVVGNEPFIESRNHERGDALLNFYKEMAEKVRDYRERRESDTPIYLGAFNRLDLPGRRYPGVVDMFEYIRATDWIAGADIHIHHKNAQQMRDFLEYTEGQLRDDQRIIITEFSLVWHWKDNLTQKIPADFASNYGYDTESEVHKYLDNALKNQVPKVEWDDFLSQSPWFENRKKYLSESFEMFKEYSNFHVATYALRQSFPFDRNFTATNNPWILNGLFANRTVEKDSKGMDQFNYAFIDDFQGIQEESEADN